MNATPLGTPCAFRRFALPLVAALGWLAATPGHGTEASEQPATLRYDAEYPVMNYGSVAADNAIARLQEQLDRGKVKLQFKSGRGYLDSLLQSLQIDSSSQTLVYSRTSLQVGTIRAATPRAIYFNDDTYVAWVQDSDVLELATMDTVLGQVFYTLPNREAPALQFERELQRCLSCHDTYSLSGGGVPRFLLMSSYVGTSGIQLVHEGSIVTTDRTPLRYRWGGWYVTGQHGDQVHLGNIHVTRAEELVNLDGVRRGNLSSIDDLFDTRPYLTARSDIVALLVLQHQTHIQNLITRVNFEVRTALAESATADELTTETRELLKGDMDALVNAMLFVDAAPYTAKISGNAGFDAWFQRQGPRDRRGRSLRELDLNTHLFRRPMSYLIHSQAFDALPGYATEYLYQRFADILDGREQSALYAHLSAEDRKVIREILTSTKPAFARAAKRAQQAAPRTKS